MGVMSWNGPSVLKCTMTHAKKSFSTEICAGAIISVAQYLAPLRYAAQLPHVMVCWPLPHHLLATAPLFVGHCRGRTLDLGLRGFCGIAAGFVGYIALDLLGTSPLVDPGRSKGSSTFRAQRHKYC
jgi:hypothetical protein